MRTTCEHGNQWFDPAEPWPGGSNPYCRVCYLAAGGNPRNRVRLPQRGTCLHLGKRLEFRPGCGGRLCVHECEAGEPEAIPGITCQTCSKWEPE